MGAVSRSKDSVRKRHRHISAVSVIVTVILAIYVLILLIPYVYALFASLSTYQEYYFNIFPFPKEGLKLINYVDAWKSLKFEGTGIPEMVLNSLWYSLAPAVLGVLLSSFGAYICAKYQFPGRNFIYMFALITMMIPIVGSTPSILKYVSALGGYNSYSYVIIMAQTVNAAFIIMYSCFKSVDWAYAEAAFIDGAGHFTVFFKIMLPQVISPMTALILSDFILYWADVESSLLYHPELPTLSTGLYYFRTFVITAAGMQRYPAYFAALLLCMIPTILLFAIFQNKLMDIQISGGIKG